MKLKLSTRYKYYTAKLDFFKRRKTMNNVQVIDNTEEARKEYGYMWGC